MTKTEKSLAEARDIRKIYANDPYGIDRDYAQIKQPLKEKNFIQRFNPGLPHEAAAIIAGKLHEIYDYILGSGNIAERVQKLLDSGKLEELSSGAAVTEWKEDSTDSHVVLSIPLLRGYLSENGSIRLNSGERPDFFKLLYQ